MVTNMSVIVLDDKMHINNPLELFTNWYNSYKEIPNKEHSAMALATASKIGLPSVRMVLLKEYSNNGFVFFTNLNSRKGFELQENKNVSLLFYWDELNRQIRIEGAAEFLPSNKSDNYYKTRPHGHKINAWSSKQSEVIENEEELQQRYNYFVDKFKNNDDIPRPEHWGGVIVKHKVVEFWQEGIDRMHTRYRYSLSGNIWSMNKLYP